MPDIRAFFGPKGGAAPAKPAAPKKEDDAVARKGRGSEFLCFERGKGTWKAFC